MKRKWLFLTMATAVALLVPTLVFAGPSDDVQYPDYTLEQLDQVHAKYAESLTISGIVDGICVARPEGEKPRLEVYIYDESKLHTVPPELDGVPLNIKVIPPPAGDLWLMP